MFYVYQFVSFGISLSTFFECDHPHLILFMFINVHKICLFLILGNRQPWTTQISTWDKVLESELWQIHPQFQTHRRTEGEEEDEPFPAPAPLSTQHHQKKRTAVVVHTQVPHCPPPLAWPLEYLETSRHTWWSDPPQSQTPPKHRTHDGELD